MISVRRVKGKRTVSSLRSDDEFKSSFQRRNNSPSSSLDNLSQAADRSIPTRRTHRENRTLSNSSLDGSRLLLDSSFTRRRQTCEKLCLDSNCLEGRGEESDESLRVDNGALGGGFGEEDESWSEREARDVVVGSEGSCGEED